MTKTREENRDTMSEEMCVIYQTLAHRHVHAGETLIEKFRRMCVLTGIQIAYGDAIEGAILKSGGEIVDEFYCLSRDMQFTPLGWVILDELYKASLK